jgi:hypothetical protein
MAQVESFQFEERQLQDAVKPVFSLNIIACQLLIELVEILQLGYTGA